MDGPNNNNACERVIVPRNKKEPGSVDLVCPAVATTDIIVSFNGLRYVVPLCVEHKAHADEAAASRRAERSGTTRRERDAATNERRVAVARASLT